jgi:hypothetical protein
MLPLSFRIPLTIKGGESSSRPPVFRHCMPSLKLTTYLRLRAAKSCIAFFPLFSFSIVKVYGISIFIVQSQVLVQTQRACCETKLHLLLCYIKPPQSPAKMTSPLHNLPVELLEGVLIELAYPDLANARNVCHSFRTLCDSDVILQERKRLLELRHASRSDTSMAVIRRKIDPFFTEFDRNEYLVRIGRDAPVEFTTWVLETPREDIIGWHWPGLQGEHSRDRYQELGLGFIDAVVFSRHLKPGYTLLPSAVVMEVEDPDYSEFNDTDFHFYPGSWQCQRLMRETKVRALQIWADMSGFAPKITLLILSGSERWNGCVWQTESRTPIRHSPESITGNMNVQLIWQRPLGTWTDYLKLECKTLQERYNSLAQLKTYRAGLHGRAYYSIAEEES